MMDFIYDTDDEDPFMWIEESDADDDEFLFHDHWPFEQALAEDDDLLYDDSKVTLCSTSPTEVKTVHLPRSACHQIEVILADIGNDLLNAGAKVSLPISSRPRSRVSCVSIEDVVSLERKICFPGKKPQDAWRLTTYMRVLELIYQALVDGLVMTKRDIFYQDPSLFNHQYIVDRIIDDIAYSFKVPRAALNVVAAAKGLIAGAFTFNGQQSNEGLLIPVPSDTDVVDCSSATWILVIEKEAVFRSVVTSASWVAISEHAIALTVSSTKGKGYPDIATRAMLRTLADSKHHSLTSMIPIYGLVDYDPDGLAIFSSYKHGSTALVHENADLVVPRISWLGLKTSDLSHMQDGVGYQALMPLTPRDRQKARSMLNWLHLSEEQGDEELRVALQTMLMLDLRAEIQILDLNEGGIAGWLKSVLG